MNELDYSDFLKDETDLEREAGLILEHYGVKGMRWGVRRTPEQLGHKTEKKKSTSLIKSAVTSIKKKRAASKKAAAKKTATKAKVQEKKQEESEDKIREKVLSSTDAALIYKYRSLLSSSELQERIDRINKEQRIKDLIPDPNADRKKKIKKGEETLKSLASMAESVGKIYDNYNKVTGNKNKSDGGGKKDKQQNQNEQKKKDDKDKTKQEKKKEKKNTAANAKAAQELFSDPGIQALLALGMLTPAERNAINKQGHEENERRKKSSGSNS